MHWAHSAHSSRRRRRQQIRGNHTSTTPWGDLLRTACGAKVGVMAPFRARGSGRSKRRRLWAERRCHDAMMRCVRVSYPPGTSHWALGRGAHQPPEPKQQCGNARAYTRARVCVRASARVRMHARSLSLSLSLCVCVCVCARAYVCNPGYGISGYGTSVSNPTCCTVPHCGRTLATYARVPSPAEAPAAELATSLRRGLGRLAGAGGASARGTTYTPHCPVEAENRPSRGVVGGCSLLA